MSEVDFSESDARQTGQLHSSCQFELGRHPPCVRVQLLNWIGATIVAVAYQTSVCHVFRHLAPCSAPSTNREYTSKRYWRRLTLRRVFWSVVPRRGVWRRKAYQGEDDHKHHSYNSEESGEKKKNKIKNQVVMQ